MERQTNLREQLSSAKDLSELMIDIAYAGIYTNSVELADEVFDLSVELDEMINDMRMRCVMSARSPQDAADITTVLHLLSCIDLISKGAEEIARIIDHKLELPSHFIKALSEAGEILNKIVVSQDNFLAGRSFEDLNLPKENGIRVIAIRRDRRWITELDGETVFLDGDRVLICGSRENVDEIRQLIGLRKIKDDEFEHESVEVENAVSLLVDMKDASELAVGLAYSSFLFNDKNLASVVVSISEKMSRKRERVETWILEGVNESKNSLQYRGLLHLGEASETICVACADMVKIILEDMRVHPIFSQAMEDANEVIVKIEVQEDSQAVGKYVYEHDSSFVAMTHIRDGKYLYDLSRPRLLEVGDEIIARGPFEAKDSFITWLQGDVVED